MPRRLNKTLVDYLVIAISPALIMLLVGSLVFFLIEVFYQGTFQDRLQFIFAMFVIGAVLIGRISIERGREHAALFALPLGIVTLVAINKFVEFQGAMASLSFFINCGLVAIVWWSADKLTWDCTLIDEREEDSGEGLLEAVGLDRPDRAALQKEINPAPPEPEATTSRDGPPPGWWGRFTQRRSRPHAPGVWVVYFSLAALPLFGIGQLLIPSGNLRARQDAFQFLFAYTASGLALLLSTSFLGLRRYLRQRRQEMPRPMASLWLGLGAALIAGVMLAALLLPRTNAEYAVSTPPFRVGSPDQHASSAAVIPHGVPENQPGAAAEQQESRQPDGKPSNAATSDKPDNTPSGQSKEASEGKSKQEAGGEPREKSRDGTGEASKGEPKQTPKGESKEASKGEPKETPKDGKDSSGDGRGAPRASESQVRMSPRPEKDVPERATARQAPPDQPRPQPTTQQPQPSANPPRALPSFQVLTQIPAMLAGLLKWLFYGALAILIGYAIWKNRAELWAAVREFLQQLADLWHRLFGARGRRDSHAAEGAVALAPPPKRFADFVDPFAAGTAARYRPEELVRYSFEALEAWARDRGRPRHPEQTPHEFVRTLAADVAALADDAPPLADLYCQAAYSARGLPNTATARLARLWQTLAAERGAGSSPC
jgi:hypothetical protein